MTIDNFTTEDFRRVIYDLSEYFTERVDGNEVVFTTSLGTGVELWIYTSTSANTERVRGDSADAIRVQFRGETRKPNEEYETLVLSNGRYKHIKRTSGWEDRVADRVHSYVDQYPDILRWCPECESPLAIRSGRKGVFAGCVDYHPDDDDACGYTEDL